MKESGKTNQSKNRILKRSTHKSKLLIWKTHKGNEDESCEQHGSHCKNKWTGDTEEFLPTQGMEGRPMAECKPAPSKRGEVGHGLCLSVSIRSMQMAKKRLRNARSQGQRRDEVS